MRRFQQMIPVFVLILSLVVFGCAEQKAEEMFKTAQFEELQTNWKHAGELYERIVSDYPDTETAGKAKDRLKALAEEEKYSGVDSR